MREFQTDVHSHVVHISILCPGTQYEKMQKLDKTMCSPPVPNWIKTHHRCGSRRIRKVMELLGSSSKPYGTGHMSLPTFGRCAS